MKNVITRMKSPVFWAEVVIIAAQIGKTTGLYELDNEFVSNLQNFITVLFTLFATLNNPATKDQF